MIGNSAGKCLSEGDAVKGLLSGECSIDNVGFISPAMSNADKVRKALVKLRRNEQAQRDASHTQRVANFLLHEC